MEDEIIEEINEQGNVIKKRLRKELEEGQFLHKVSLIIPKTKEGKLILSKRAVNKNPFPDTWVCAIGGKVSAGESPEQAAQREMKEEGNFITPLKKVAETKYIYDDYKAIFHIFTTIEPMSKDEFTPNSEEVQYFSEFYTEDIKKMISVNPKEFAPTFIAAFNAFCRGFKQAS